tara:strand:- start:793 stop:2115 length:1323 start_codon:yes stop_codon:yes gene_type:complete
MKLKGWGGYPIHETKITTPYFTSDIIKLIKEDELIARGNGRSYGDSAIGKINTISMKNFNKIISFDMNSGQLVAEAGVLLEDIIKLFLPKGWFPFVTPGSKYVTLGGMVAADVHGKNHHKDGNFSKYVNWIDLICEDGSIKRCSNKENTNLFNWSLGGMGLTGIILNVSIQLKKIETSWIKQNTLVAKNLDDTIDIFEKNMDYTYSVAWIDCLKKGSSMGRSLVYLGEHAKICDLSNKEIKSPLKVYKKYKKSIPFNLPKWVMNQSLVSIFNSAFYLIGKLKKKNNLIDWDSFFYPLDSIIGWNKIYGKKGFIQFQCVIPIDKSTEGLKNLLRCLADSDVGSFLSVLKRFGKDESKFSFPMEGYTLALDFPNNKKTLDLIKKLDEITIKYGGRFYLAKDSRISAKIFNKSDSRIEKFLSFREKNNLIKKFKSTQSNRLEI